MKAVILAGGLGSRLSEETETRPKPMIEIGARPILWHIMKIYSGHGITDFIVCRGYKGYVIKEFFANYYLHSCDYGGARRRRGYAGAQPGARRVPARSSAPSVSSACRSQLKRRARSRAA
jgi:NDP-sugar pyrophosphorylase family protein